MTLLLLSFRAYSGHGFHMEFIQEDEDSVARHCLLPSSLQYCIPQGERLTRKKRRTVPTPTHTCPSLTVIPSNKKHAGLTYLPSLPYQWRLRICCVLSGDLLSSLSRKGCSTSCCCSNCDLSLCACSHCMKDCPLEWVM